MKIYHNPRCTKSRETLVLIQEKGTEVEIVEYLKTPPTKDEIKEILNLLGISPQEIIRKGEKLYKEKYKGKDFTDDAWIKILADNPILIERPIVVSGKRGIIGRPPENVMALF